MPDTVTSLEQRSIAVVLGTRPEIVKLAGLIDHLGPAARIIHSGQHYDDNMSHVFFAEMGIRPPDVQLDAGGQTRAVQIASILAALEAQFAVDRPAAVVVQGDTNTVAAGALAANARGIPLVHVEAGLRSYDNAMPEEHNRVIADHLATLLCAATPGNVRNLRREGITKGVVLTGNTVVGAVRQQTPDPAKVTRLCGEFGLEPDRYVLATIHRPENTDDPDRLRSILTELTALPVPVIMPLHPRTRAAITAAGIERDLGGIRVIEPVGSSVFLGLASRAALLVSDSGGVQEECTVLKRPLLVVRRSTERPEAMPVFARLVQPNEIAATGRDLLQGIQRVLDSLVHVASPFGDDAAAARIGEALEQHLKEESSATAAT